MKIELKHFGQHAALTIESRTPVTMIVGANRSGKTTVRDAIEFVLLGTCALRGFGLKKDVARYMIHEAANRASVELSINGWGVRRSMTSAGAQKIQLDRHGNNGWVEVSPAEWAQFLPAVQNPMALRCALESDSLWTDATERAALMVALAGASGMTAEDVRGQIPPHLLPDARKADDVALVASLCETAVEAGFAGARGVAVELRREAKRALAALSAETDPGVEMEVEGTDIREGSLDELRRGLAEARSELGRARDSATLDLGRLTGLLDAASAQLAAADERWGAVSMEIWRDFSVEPWAEGEEIGPTPTISSGDLLEEALIRKAQIQANEKAIKDLREAIAAIEKSVGSPPAFGPIDCTPPDRCPARSFSMACPVSSDVFAKAESASRAEREAEWNAGAAFRAESEEAIAAHRAEIAQHQSNIAELGTLAEGLLARANRRAELDEQTLECKRAVDLARSEVDRTSAAVEKARGAATPAQVESFAAMVAKRERIVAERESFERVQARSAEREREAASLRARVEWLDEIEAQFRPDGIEARIADSGAGWLRANLEVAAEAFGRIEITSDFDVLIDGRHVAAASKSEQRCAGMALQIAIADALRLPLIVVDELDALDATWRARFVDLCATHPRVGGVVELIGLATASARPGKPPEGFTTVWLQPGRAEVIQGGRDAE